MRGRAVLLLSAGGCHSVAVPGRPSPQPLNARDTSALLRERVEPRCWLPLPLPASAPCDVRGRWRCLVWNHCVSDCVGDAWPAASTSSSAAPHRPGSSWLSAVSMPRICRSGDMSAAGTGAWLGRDAPRLIRLAWRRLQASRARSATASSTVAPPAPVSVPGRPASLASARPCSSRRAPRRACSECVRSGEAALPLPSSRRLRSVAGCRGRFRRFVRAETITPTPAPDAGEARGCTAAAPLASPGVAAKVDVPHVSARCRRKPPPLRSGAASRPLLRVRRGRCNGDLGTLRCVSRVCRPAVHDELTRRLRWTPRSCLATLAMHATSKPSHVSPRCRRQAHGVSRGHPTRHPRVCGKQLK